MIFILVLISFVCVLKSKIKLLPNVNIIVISDLLSRQEKEIEELKAQMLAVMPTEFVTPVSGNVSKLRLSDGSPLDPNASVYTPKQLCSDAWTASKYKSPHRPLLISIFFELGVEYFRYLIYPDTLMATGCTSPSFVSGWAFIFSSLKYLDCVSTLRRWMVDKIISMIWSTIRA